MRKRIGIIVLLITMLSVFTLSSRQPVVYIAEDDEVIEWQSYDAKEIV